MGLDGIKKGREFFGQDTTAIDKKIEDHYFESINDKSMFPQGIKAYRESKGVNYPTSSSLEKNQNTNTNNNQVKVNINVDKVEKTADIDEVMDTFTRRMNTYYNTRNGIGDVY